jgi:hypothetical protein
MKNNGIKTGDHVIFNKNYLEMMELGSVSDVYEVTDSRHVGQGNYVFSLTPVTVPATLNASHTNVDPDDLEKFG